MAENTSPAADQQFSAIVNRIFSDQKFANALEQNPEKALTDAGFKLSAAQTKALHSGAAEARKVAVDPLVASWVRPVVSVLTKGTQPVVQVVVNSVVVAAKSEEEQR
jgi:hypothetical protein